jgi:hypothetical protein
VERPADAHRADVMRPNVPLPQIATGDLDFKALPDHDPAADAHLVTLLKAGGAVLMRKLATWEFALGRPRWEHA